MQVAGQRGRKRRQCIVDVGRVEQLFLNLGIESEGADARGEHLVESGRKFSRSNPAHDLGCLDECVVSCVGHRAVAGRAPHRDAAGTGVFLAGGQQHGRAVVAE